MRRNLFIFFLTVITVLSLSSAVCAKEGELIPITVGDVERFKNYASQERVLFLRDFYSKNKENNIEDEVILNEVFKLFDFNEETANEIRRRYNKLIFYFDTFIQTVENKLDEINASILEHYPGQTDKLIDLKDFKTWENIKYIHINNESIESRINSLRGKGYFSNNVAAEGLIAELASCANTGKKEIYMSFMVFLEDGYFLRRQYEGGTFDGISVDFTGSENIELSQILFPMEKKIKLNDKNIIGYTEKVYFPFKAQLIDNKKEGSVKAVLTADVCSEKGCRKEELEQMSYKIEKASFDSSFCQNIKDEFFKKPDNGNIDIELNRAFFKTEKNGKVDLIISLKLPSFEDNSLDLLIKNEHGLLFSDPFIIEDKTNMIVKYNLLNPEKMEAPSDIYFDVSYSNAGKRFKITPWFLSDSSNIYNSFLSFSLIDIIKSFVSGIQLFLFTPVLFSFLMLLYMALVDQERRYGKTSYMYDGMASALFCFFSVAFAAAVYIGFLPVFIWGRQFTSPLFDFIFLMLFLCGALNWKKMFDDVFVEKIAHPFSFVFSAFGLESTKEKAGFLTGLISGCLLLISPVTYLYYDAYNVISRSFIINSLALAGGLFAPFFVFSLFADDVERVIYSKRAAWVLNRILPFPLYGQIVLLLCSIGFLTNKSVVLSVLCLLFFLSIFVFKAERIVNKAVLIATLIGCIFIVPFKPVEKNPVKVWSEPFNENALYHQINQGKAVYLNVYEDFCFLCLWNRFVVRYHGMPEQVENGDLKIMRIKSDDPFLKRILSGSGYSTLPMNIIFSPKYPQGKVVDAVFGLWKSKVILEQVYPQPIKVVGPNLEKLLKEKKPKQTVKDTD